MKTLALILLGSGIVSGLGAVPAVETASTASLLSRSGAGHSSGPSFSSDGRFLVFVSQANNLVTIENRQPFLDVFVRDLLTSETSLVSINSSGTGGANDNANYPVISGNGNRIVFVSAASDLVPGDTNLESDLFVRELVAGTTQLVSVDHSGNGGGIRPSSEVSSSFLSGDPSLSADGRWVAFVSRATNLVSLPDENMGEDIYVRDLETSLTQLVSVDHAGSGAASGASSAPTISADGRKVVFISTGTDLVTNVTGQVGAVYVRDLVTQTTSWISDGLASSNVLTCSKPVLSGDGSTVVFTAAATNGSSFWLCHRLVASDAATIIATNDTDFVGVPAVNENGQAVAFSAALSVHGDSVPAIYRWKQSTGGNELLRISQVGSNAFAGWPAIDASGNRIDYVGQEASETNGAVLQVFVYETAEGAIRLISATLEGASSRRGVDLSVPVFHPVDGRVAFSSAAADLVSGDLNQASDVFLRDRASGHTELVTDRAENRPALTGAAASTLSRGGMSGDGRFLLYRTFARNVSALSTEEAEIEPGIWEGQVASLVVRDRLAQTNITHHRASPVFDAIMNPDGKGITETRVEGSTMQVFSGGVLVSARLSDGGFSAGVSKNPSVSGDGRYVVFESSAPDLVSDSRGEGIYLRDFQLGITSTVSAPPHSTVNAYDDSYDPIISLDGRWVVFGSYARYLTPGVTGSPYNLYARDLTENRTIWLGTPVRPVISLNSRRVAFGRQEINVFDLLLASNRLACTNCQFPSLNAEGTILAYESVLPRISQVSVVNLQTDTTELVSVNHQGTEGGNGSSRGAALSADGRLVVFSSSASDLVPNDDNGQTDLFLRDLVTKTTFLLTPGKDGDLANRTLFQRPISSWNGRVIAFQSTADRLHPSDYNGTSDIFVLELGSGDRDADGMDDAWEIVYFDSLERDGNGDFDRDGVNDRTEYQAGSNPANDLPLLAVTALLRRTDGSVVLYWNSVPGKTYKVQTKAGGNAPNWSDLSGDLVATGATLSFTDEEPVATQQFYRIALQP